MTLVRVLVLALGVLMPASLPIRPIGAPVAAADGCRFVFGFATLHDLIPTIVGACLGDEQHNPANGDGLQYTTKGLLVWRRADNFTAFTDGADTWVNGRYGVQQRPNGRRFSWEANPGGLPLVPVAGIERCHTGELAISQAGGGVAVGNVGVSFRVRSLAAAPCSLVGYPGAQLFDANRQPLPTSVRWSRSGYLIGMVPEQRVILARGSSAYFVLEYTDNPSPGDTCPTASFLLITPPDEFTPATVPVRGIAPCGGRLLASPILPSNPLAAQAG